MGYAAGTLIRTARGDVPVEMLKVGDLVATAAGAQRPIKSLGHRTLDTKSLPRRHDDRPVRIGAHAFAPDGPSRDLVVSSNHSICLDVVGEVLIPVGCLANGATITTPEVDEITYWLVELDEHDVLFAEGLPCESCFADVTDDAADATPHASGNTRYPVHREGALVDCVRDRLCERACELGWRLAIEDELGGLWLEVDGERLEPARHGLFARATLSPDVREVRLRSSVGVPSELFGHSDDRRLGLRLASLVIDDGLACRREIACTDERLLDGFHAHESTHRWTDGDARLPPELWESCQDDFQLQLVFAGPAVAGWVAPEDCGATRTEPATA